MIHGNMWFRLHHRRREGLRSAWMLFIDALALLSLSKVFSKARPLNSHGSILSEKGSQLCFIMNELITRFL